MDLLVTNVSLYQNVTGFGEQSLVQQFHCGTILGVINTSAFHSDLLSVVSCMYYFFLPLESLQEHWTSWLHRTAVLVLNTLKAYKKSCSIIGKL